MNCDDILIHNYDTHDGKAFYYNNNMHNILKLIHFPIHIHTYIPQHTRVTDPPTHTQIYNMNQQHS